jgi:hypothetical protein
MDVSKLDRIIKLGFTLNLSWGRDITIIYEDFSSEELSLTEDVFVLIYTHPLTADYTFLSALDIVFDEFNSWYFKNNKILKKWIDTKDEAYLSKIESLGDITGKVNRQLRINNLLDESYDF